MLQNIYIYNIKHLTCKYHVCFSTDTQPQTHIAHTQTHTSPCLHCKSFKACLSLEAFLFKMKKGRKKQLRWSVFQLVLLFDWLAFRAQQGWKHSGIKRFFLLQNKYLKKKQFLIPHFMSVCCDSKSHGMTNDRLRSFD